MSSKKPVVLLILDGWGQREPAPDNAISCANTPHWDALVATHPVAQLTTHGLAVGLPEGQMGNSEVGHMNIGAGRVVYQDLTRITKAIADGDFQKNQALIQAMNKANESQSTLHLFGLLSNGGVHSHEDHFLATLDLALSVDVSHIAVHLFTDGRDVAPRSALSSIERLMPYQDNPRVTIASVSGRYFAMDRDQRWERTGEAWQAIACGQASYQATSAMAAVEAAYERGEDDEFISPTVIGSGCPFQSNDVGIFINFRSDRARQLSHALINQTFNGFSRDCGGETKQLALLVTMTQYADDIDGIVAFPPQSLANGLGEVVSRAGLNQLRLAETEKYAHVTYFFNGGKEAPFTGEDRVLVPSPKVATYDLAPEMSAAEVGKVLTQDIQQRRHDLIITNLANPDMVGHTGDMLAAQRAVESVDAVLGQVLQASAEVGADLLITADHGNAEQMLDPNTQQPHTAHTTNTVPFIYAGPRPLSLTPQGSLRDIAPTILTLLAIDVPPEMTGQPLLTDTQ